MGFVIDASSMIKLISWNVRKVGEKIASRQAEALCKQEPDIIALQDVNIHSIQKKRKIKI